MNKILIIVIYVFTFSLFSVGKVQNNKSILKASSIKAANIKINKTMNHKFKPLPEKRMEKLIKKSTKNKSNVKKEKNIKTYKNSTKEKESPYREYNKKTIQTKKDGEIISAPILTPIPEPIVHLKKLHYKTLINLDYTDVPLQDMIKYISDITNTNFIVPDNLSRKKITIISPKKVTPLEALNAFFTVLSIQNYTVVKTGKYYKIVPEREGRKPHHIYFQNDNVPYVDYMLTKIYTLKYANIKDIERLINRLKDPNSDLVTYEPSSMIILTETGRKINNIFKIIKELDVPNVNANGQIWMIPVYYADVKDLAKTIQDIFDIKNNRSHSSRNTKKFKGKVTKQDNDNSDLNIEKIIADERTSKLIIKCDKYSKNKIVELIRKLDAPVEDDSSIHVYQLQNAKAKDISQTISSLVSGSRSRSRSKKASSLGGGVIFQGEVKVTADDSTNSLVIVASGRDYNSLRRVIDSLDIRRKQVYVEAVIMEISVDKNVDFGVSIDGGYKKNIMGEDVPFFGGTNYGGLSAIAINPASLTGFAFGAMAPPVNITKGISVPGFGVILKALQTNSNVNVLSSPQVLTMDNEEAEFVVGENVPFPSGISNAFRGTSTGNYSPMISIQRQDVAIQLKIKPQISGNNQVKLEVNQEIKEVKSIDPILGPTTSKRKVKTAVVVPDQKTIVIGGLMKDNVKVTENKVPILGSIPILGNLFKYQTKRVNKSNLLVFLTPYIIRDSNDMEKIWKKKMNEFEEFKRLKTRADKGFDIFTDYDKKRGLLSEINIKAVEYEKKIKRENELKKKEEERKYDKENKENEIKKADKTGDKK